MKGRKFKHRIKVKTLSGADLTFHVDEYELREGFVIFTDVVSGEVKTFHGSNCEIEPAKIHKGDLDE